MASGENSTSSSFILKGVVSLSNSKFPGILRSYGSYSGKVYPVRYCELVCTAKEICPSLVEDVEDLEIKRKRIVDQRWSTLRHPNIVQFIGVYYPNGEGVASKMRLPITVMEMMADSLDSFVNKHNNIPAYIKYSIVHDVALGLCYLHNHDPPIVHQNLIPNNILLTAHPLLAKISGFGLVKTIKYDCRETAVKVPDARDFMPPEALRDTPEYDPSMNIFAFAGIILHTFNQCWPRPIDLMVDSKATTLSEVERRQHWLDKMTEEITGALTPLVEECLNNEPVMRPNIVNVCKKIQASKDAYAYKKEYPDVITLYQQNIQLKGENSQQSLRFENKLLRNENGRMNAMEKQRTKIQEMGSIAKSSIGKGLTTKRSKLRTEAPPLIPTLTGSKYHIKWTQLADPPVPFWRAHVAVQHHKVYVTGLSQVKDTEYQVYVYDVNTDEWNHLPPSGHYYGIPQIIGSKLTIIGGRLSANNERTNKVSTFDEDSRTWKSYYPDLLKVRSGPGVVTHLEHVIVAGGSRGPVRTRVTQDDIEVLNWVENSHWRMVSVKLPVPMFGFTPIISDDHLVIVGYHGADSSRYKSAYKIPAADITDQRHKYDLPIRWIKLTGATHWYTSLIPNSCPPVIVGGEDSSGGENSTNIPTADIRMYDDSSNSWKKVGSLSSPRSYAAVSTIDDNSVIVIGGYTETRSKISARWSSLKLLELGQAELCHYVIIDY